MIGYFSRPVCTKHPRYSAKQQPRTSCEPCWVIWFAIQGWMNRGDQLVREKKLKMSGSRG